MDLHHRLPDLFDQLGLPSGAADIRQFIRQHQSLADDVALAEAPFWNAAQSAFLREQLRQDADWAIVVDCLNAALRSPRTPDDLPQAPDTDHTPGAADTGRAGGGADRGLARSAAPMASPHGGLRQVVLVAGMACMLTLGACSSMSTRTKNTSIGAAAGAVAGSVITGTTTGAAVGAVIGGVIGNEEGKRKEGR